MKRSQNRFGPKIVMYFLLIVLLFPALQSSAETCSARWFAYPQVPYVPGAYPDWSSTYWTYLFNNSDKSKMLEFEGKFPYARYMSYVLYDWPTGDLIGSLLDKDIEPDAGSENPFRPGVERDVTDRNYTVRIVQQGSPDEGGQNVIAIPPNVENVVLIMRIYLPDYPYGDRGGVHLPYATAYAYSEDGSVAETDCPPVLPTEDIFESMDPPDPVAEEKLLEDLIVFYRHHPIDGEGLFANGNNPYLSAPLRDVSEDQVALVRFRAPTFPHTYLGEIESFTGKEQVRYWSVCLVDITDGSTSRCIYDEKAVLDADGFFNLAIIPNDYEVTDPAADLNYLPWGYHQRPAVMIRQQEPREDFIGNFSNAEETYLVDPEDDSSILSVREMTVEQFREYSLELFDTNNGLLSDYNPMGIYCDLETFENGQCVID